jgi:hypothetical protein
MDMTKRGNIIKQWFMKRLGYSWQRVGYIGCCRWWTDCEHYAWVK